MRHDLKPIIDLVPEVQSPDSRRDIMRKLLSSIRDIELQLGSRVKRKNIDGLPMTPAESALWRMKAMKALNHNVDLYRRYKALERDSNERKLGEAIASFISYLGHFIANFGARHEVPHQRERPESSDSDLPHV